jgi:hypothetical protein
MNNEDFFSIDRLLEFGLGMGMAQQMINMMNQSMKSMYIPGSIQSMPQPITSMYYVAIDGQQVGPLNESELMGLIRDKKVSKDTLSWMPGMTTWLPIEKVPAILKLIALTPPPLKL